MPITTRLAPSPTGSQHIGNARTYLVNWLFARANQGQIILRIEDIDSPRVKADAENSLIIDLQWLGLDWDAGPMKQTHRLAEYRLALQQLQAKELVYPCTCTRRDIELAASAPHAEHEGPTYPGTCAQRQVRDAQALARGSFAWRFRSQPSIRTFQDEFLGFTSVPEELLGDFVVWKADDTPAYQLAVVVDDALMKITHVLRGDDLVSSTPRQMQLYTALGYAIPKFIHIPLVVGPDGRRLAKRHGDTRIASLRQAGVPPERLIGMLAWSCGWQRDCTPVQAIELLNAFALKTIPRAAFVLSRDLLASIGYLVAS